MVAKKEISLLPDEENIGSVSGNVVRWLTTVGRVIIVFTELIVICAFISRFWLDRKNADLSEIIRQQKAILETTKEFEKEYALLQQKLRTVKSFISFNPKYGVKINSLIYSTPREIIYKKISLNSENQKITADATLDVLSEESIIGFITNLKLNPDIESVDIKKIEKKERENSYSMDIFITFKNT